MSGGFVWPNRKETLMDDYAQRIKKINEEIERLEEEKYDLE